MLQVDIWGDGVEIGGVEVTRLTIRLLCDAVSAQSSNAVLCVACYRGKDARFPLEQNFGPTILGHQESGWLYQQTKELHTAGVKLTYSGDSPFLLRLVLGVNCEKTNATPSLLPLYVEDSKTDPTTFLPTKCHPVTGRRMDVEIPFRKTVPTTSLVYVKDIRSVCPDTTHMVSRCVEKDTKRMGQKVMDEKPDSYATPFRRFEENLTARGAKKPVFQFNVTTSSAGTGKVGTISLSGTAALTIIAETSELQGAGTAVTDLYEGVWMENEILLGSNRAPSALVLRQLHPELFIRSNPVRPTDPACYISILDASELLRKSINKCIIELRESRAGLDVASFTRWAETYYQCSLLLFGEKVQYPLCKPIIYPLYTH